MDTFLLTLFFFARPIMFVHTELNAAGLNFFELITMLFSGVLALLALGNVLFGKSVRVSATEWWIIIFIAWCTAIALIYPDSTDFKAYVKFVLPLATFIILKRAITAREQFLNLLWWCILGYAIPVFLSALLIYQGIGISQKIYWTGLERYQGAYFDIHTMGHNMGFLLMLIMIFLVIRRSQPKAPEAPSSWPRSMFLGALGVAALYCLYNAQVRTVYVGLLAFFLLAFLAYNRVLLLLFASVSIALGTVLAPLLSTIFFDVIEPLQGKQKIEMVGSGRPNIWHHNLAIYAELPLDRQLAGVGIGNWVTGRGEQFSRDKITAENVWNSHNDFLEVLMETGAVGLVMILTINITMALAIARMPHQDKSVFGALFVAVAIMNFLSNSYINRFGLAQLYFMLMTYVELPEAMDDAFAREASAPPEPHLAA
jgi:O-Antigen ligase